MKPGDHPEFFRLAPPQGASRESTIRLDAEGRFFHDGDRVEHAALEAALHGWIARHPDDGRFILTNGYDWCYFRVDDAPYVVRALDRTTDPPLLVLSDGAREPLDPAALRVGDDDALYARVKRDRGEFEAKFSRHAQADLAPWLVETAGGGLALRVAGVDHPLP